MFSCRNLNNGILIKCSVFIIGLIIISCVLFTKVYAANGDIKDTIYTTDILTQVDGKNIQSYSIDGETLIALEDLENYGYTVYYNDNIRSVFITKTGTVNPDYNPSIERGKVGGTAETLQEYGYNEVNLNLGCPSKTVVTKGRGAGFLDRPDELDKFLDEIFRKCDMKISIKTRLGMDDPEEFEDLLTIYNKYPLEELIVHARVQKDYYKNTPRLETFGEAVERAKSPVCYNGDIVTAEDCTRLQDMFPTLDCIMTGRGTLKNPALAREIRGGAPASKEEIRRFHDMMYNEYCEDLSGDRNILFRMKELWSYLAPMFTNNKKYAKKIKKAEKCVVYENAVRELFSCEQLIGEVENADMEKNTGSL